MRTKYYKAATTTLDGPLRRASQPYLPGTIHKPDWLDEDSANSCTHGLYYTAHRRVAARWGEVVLEVRVLGKQVKADERVRPSHQPGGIAANRYQKYRTDLMEVVRIVGVTGYSPYDPTETGSRRAAKQRLASLNDTLRRHGHPELELTGESLERLRDDGFQLWATRELPLGRRTLPLPKPIFYKEHAR